MYNFNKNLNFLLSILIAGLGVVCSPSFVNFSGFGGGGGRPPWRRPCIIEHIEILNIIHVKNNLMLINSIKLNQFQIIILQVRSEANSSIVLSTDNVSKICNSMESRVRAGFINGSCNQYQPSNNIMITLLQLIG